MEPDLFEWAVARYRESRPLSGFHYDPIQHLLFVALGASRERSASSFIHECAHSRLHPSLVGFVLETMALLEYAIYRLRILPVLDETFGAPSADLIDALMKPNRSQAQREKAKAYASSHDDRLSARLRDDEGFQTVLKDLHAIEYRRCRLLGEWRICQEGFAMTVELDVAALPVEFADLCERCFTLLGVADLTQEAMNSYREALRRHLLGAVADDPYRSGYEMFTTILRLPRSRQAIDWHIALTAAALAGHVMLPDRPLLDISESDFDMVVAAQEWSPDRRLRRLATEPGLFRDPDSPASLGEVLAQLSGLDRDQSLSMDYYDWEWRNLYGCEVITRHLALPEKLPVRETVLQAWGRVAPASPYFPPVVLLSDGRLIVSDRTPPDLVPLEKAAFVHSLLLDDFWKLVARMTSGAVSPRTHWRDPGQWPI